MGVYIERDKLRQQYRRKASERRVARQVDAHGQQLPVYTNRAIRAIWSKLIEIATRLEQMQGRPNSPVSFEVTARDPSGKIKAFRVEHS